MDPDYFGLWASADFFRPSVLREILAHSEFCKFGPKPPDSEDLMKLLEEMGGFMLWERVEKEDYQGIWLSRVMGKSKARVMVPWKFVHTAISGSAEQMKKFGFDKEPGAEAKG
jgi:hypothetical protein